MWGLVNSAIAIASFVFGLPHGAVGVAAAYALTNVLICTPLLIWYVARRGPVSAKDIVAASLRPSLIGLAVLAAILTLRVALPSVEPLPGLAYAAGLSAMIVCPFLAFSRLGRATLRDVRRLLARRADLSA